MTRVRSSRPRHERDRGLATVTGLVLIFSLTAGAVIYLARDVNRSVSERSAAQSIAFQAARSGAQQLRIGSLRDDDGDGDGAGDTVAIDAERAGDAARATADELFEGYALEGAVTRVTVAGDRVEVEVRIDDPRGPVTGVAAARVVSGP